MRGVPAKKAFAARKDHCSKTTVCYWMHRKMPGLPGQCAVDWWIRDGVVCNNNSGLLKNRYSISGDKPHKEKWSIRVEMLVWGCLLLQGLDSFIESPINSVSYQSMLDENVSLSIYKLNQKWISEHNNDCVLRQSLPWLFLPPSLQDCYEFADVFSTSSAFDLPPHQQYDCLTYS